MKCCIDDRECNNCHNCDFWSLSDSEIQDTLPNEFMKTIQAMMKSMII